jgi:flagellar biosynthesis GTPase FlhF
MEIEIQRKMQSERNQIVEQIKKQEIEKNQLKETEHQLRIKEFEKQLDDQKKLVDEMRRKLNKALCSCKGEVQELILEEVLRVTFPFDQIGEVGKGVRGCRLYSGGQE